MATQQGRADQPRPATVLDNCRRGRHLAATPRSLASGWRDRARRTAIGVLVFGLAAVMGGLGRAASPEPVDATTEAIELLGGAVDEPPGDGFEPVAVPEPTAKAIRYHREGRWIWLVARLWGLTLPAVVLATGLSTRLRNASWHVARRVVPTPETESTAPGRWSKALGAGRWLLAVAVYVVLFLVLLTVASVPLSYYAGFVRPHAYGLSNQSPGAWLRLWTIDLGVGLALTVPVVWGLYVLIRWSPRRWWLWAEALAVPIGFLMAMVKPVVVDPLYNDFGPMRNTALETRILALADRAGVGGAEVYVVDKSRDTKAVNAYVTGFLGTKRIVLWDTLLATLDDDQVLAVVGHELGHYVRGDVARGLLVTSLLTLAGLFAVQWTGLRPCTASASGCKSIAWRTLPRCPCCWWPPGWRPWSWCRSATPIAETWNSRPIDSLSS